MSVGGIEAVGAEAGASSVAAGPGRGRRAGRIERLPASAHSADRRCTSGVDDCCLLVFWWGTVSSGTVALAG